jgi:NAD+ synthase
MMVAERISGWIKEQVERAKADGVVVGLSGGVDSSVVAAISKMALKDRVLGLIMPCHSNREDERFAELAAKSIEIETRRIDLTPVYDRLIEIFPKGSKIALVNIKPRLRMLTLYYFANNLNYLVAGTSNRSEIMVGYFTKYGDGGADILPIGGLLKTEVVEIAKELRIPDEIIKRRPSAGLWRGQTDEDELGISYKDLDMAIDAIDRGREGVLPDELFRRVEELIKESSHKRSPPSVFML